MEKVAGWCRAGSRMQVDGRRGGVLVMKGAVRVSSMVWIGERQLGERTGEVVQMTRVVWVSSAVWVRKKQLGGRTGGVVVMKGAMWVSSTVWVRGRGVGVGVEPDSHTRGTMKRAVKKLSITGAMEVERDVNWNIFSTNLI